MRERRNATRVDFFESGGTVPVMPQTVAGLDDDEVEAKR